MGSSGVLNAFIEITEDIAMTWGLDKARETYNVAHWSDGYFDINAQGELVAYPDGDQTKSAISLSELTEQFKKQGLTLPVLVRFMISCKIVLAL